MSFKCAPQIFGLVRGEPKSGQRHRANGKKIVGEMGKHKEGSSERLTKSMTYDPERSGQNRYLGFDNGYAAWDEIEHRASAYRTVGTTKKGEQYSRPLRYDAVIGFSVIFNPPSEICAEWTDEEYQKFYRDSWTVLCETEPRVFSDKNIIMTAEHFDEGAPEYEGRDRHIHVFGEAKDPEGRYCGNYIDAKFFSRLNQIYPKRMRELGWEMEDLDVTDWEKFSNKPDTNGVKKYSDSEVEAYRAERKMLWRKKGSSVNKHIINKAREANAKALNTMEQAEKILSDVELQREYLEIQKAELEAERINNIEKNDALISATEDLVDSVIEKSNQTRKDAEDDAERIRLEALNEADEIRKSAKAKAREEARPEVIKEIKDELNGRKAEIEASILQIENNLAASRNGTVDPDLIAFMNSYKVRTRDGQLISLMDAYSDPYRKFQEQREANRKKVDEIVRKGKDVMQKAGENIEDIGFIGGKR